MKITIQFENNSDLSLSEDVDIEVPTDVMKQFEKVAKDHNTSVDSVISFYLQGILRQLEAETLESQEVISASDS